MPIAHVMRAATLSRAWRASASIASALVRVTGTTVSRSSRGGLPRMGHPSGVEQPDRRGAFAANPQNSGVHVPGFGDTIPAIRAGGGGGAVPKTMYPLSGEWNRAAWRAGHIRGSRLHRPVEAVLGDGTVSPQASTGRCGAR
jgi:hypothetical protein